ncbi:hypothetical protein AAVH_28147 [Aphelenchoides avenae]|nr:hypothetical protein AAVH_28147 [Aphelenchus avenae]
MVLTGLRGEAEKKNVEEQPPLVKAETEPLAADPGTHSSPLLIEKDSLSEEEDDASFENLDLSAVEAI